MCRPCAWFLLLLLGCLALTSCRSLALQRADRARLRGDYAEALERYQALYRKTPQLARSECARLSRQEAVLALCLGRYELAWQRLERAQRLDGDSLSALPEHMRAALGTARYLEAEALAQRALRQDSTDAAALRTLASARLSAQEDRDSSYRVTALPRLTSAAGELAPSFAGQGRRLFFASSRRRPQTKQKRSPRSGEYPSALYSLAHSPSSGWQGLPQLVPALADKRYTYSCPQVLDDQLYFLRTPLQGRQRGQSELCALPLSELNDAPRETRVRMISLSGVQDLHSFSFSPRGEQLWIAARGVSGGLDLYRVRWREGRAEVPERLGAELNTAGNECYPQALSDSLLRFASDGHVGYGGYDLYEARQLPSGRYSLRHLERPLNSPADDYVLVPHSGPALEMGTSPMLRTASGVLVSTRGDARGRSRLYSYTQGQTYVRLEGYVWDRGGEALPGVELRLVGRSAALQEQRVVSDSTGFFAFDALADRDYVLLAAKLGYLNQYLRLHTDPTQESERYELRFWLTALGRTERLSELHYALDSVQLRPESYPVLDSLVSLLHGYPELQLELSTHADRWGEASYNEQLTQHRASAILSYLLKQGIERRRLRVEGRGQRQPYVVSAALHRRYPFLPEGQALEEAFVATLPPEWQQLCDALNRRCDYRFTQAK